jgi:hypoxanthine phosphoribosyltransferase
MLKKIVVAHDKSFELFISEQELQARTLDIGAQIRKKYQDKRPLFIGVLNGAFMFAADLIRACGDMESEIIFVKLSSYEGTASSGKVISVIGVGAEVVKNRDVIIIEDIVDTGKTMVDFMKTIESYEPTSVAVATLFLKPEALQHEVKTDYVGFSIPNKFIIGYGLDYDGLGRNLPEIYQLMS